MSETLRPLNNRIIAKRLKQEEQIKGGIFLPDCAKKVNDRMEVISLPWSNDEDISTQSPLEIGDIILTEKYCGQEIVLNEETFIIINIKDIIAIVDSVK